MTGPGVRRGWAALAALGLALAWFALGAPRASRDLIEARARSLPSVQLFHLVAAGAEARDDGGLPSGAEAARAADLLEELLALETRRTRWARQALAVLDDAQVAAARAGANPVALPKSRAHRYLPPEMLLMEATLAARFGSVPAREAPAPDSERWTDAAPVDIQWGLLALITSDQPPLTEAQARRVQAALLEGMAAYEALPDRQLALEEALGPQVRARALSLSQRPLRADLALAEAPALIHALRTRGVDEAPAR